MHLDGDNELYEADPVARAAALSRAGQVYDQRAITRLWRPEAVVFVTVIFLALAVTAGLAHAWVVMAIGLVGLVYPITYFVDWRRRAGDRHAM